MDVAALLRSVKKRLEANAGLPLDEQYRRLHELREEVRAAARDLQTRWTYLGELLFGLWEVENYMNRVLGEEGSHEGR